MLPHTPLETAPLTLSARRCSSGRPLAVLSLLLLLFLVAPLSLFAQTQVTTAQFLNEYKANLAADGQNEFTRLTDATIRTHFETLLQALLDDNLVAAGNEITALAALNVHYELIELTDAPGDLPVLGFRETVDHTDANFVGWGSVLVRPLGATDAVYQAPHPIDDRFTEAITLDAYLDDCCAAVAQFSGSRRNSNGDSDGDGEPDSDVPNDTENLFHALTEWMANLTATNAPPAFYFQVHGAQNRTSEPTITGSDGAERPPDPPVTNAHPLVPIDDTVDAAGHVTMGVCGFDEGAGDDEDGDYRLCATDNVQGDFLDGLGQREQFMHFELERAARDDWDNGSGAGFDGIEGLFQALRASLGPDIRLDALSTPATACRGEDIASQISLTVTNAGEAAITSFYHIAWYLSADTVFDAGDTLLVGGATKCTPWHRERPSRWVLVSTRFPLAPPSEASTCSCFSMKRTISQSGWRTTTRSLRLLTLLPPAAMVLRRPPLTRLCKCPSAPWSATRVAPAPFSTGGMSKVPSPTNPTR